MVFILGIAVQQHNHATVSLNTRGTSLPAESLRVVCLTWERDQLGFCLLARGIRRSKQKPNICIE
jgi:hypothetical protein